MSLTGRLRKLEASVGLAVRVTGVVSTHDAGRPDAVEVRGAGAVRRMSVEEFHRHNPGAPLVVVTCYCGDCAGDGDDGEGGRWSR